jgi:hypothetical protein
MEEYHCNETIYDCSCRWTGIVLSASGSNCIDEESLNYHRQFDPSIYSPVLGYFEIIEESDLGKWTLDGKEIEFDDIGKKCLVVQRGHHRAQIALEKGVLINICENFIS